MSSPNFLKEPSFENRREEDDLLVFGYTCKYYRDDEKARWINSGKHLIPWMGDKNLLIDRYDVRGCLNDLSEFDLKNNFSNKNKNETEEEKKLELLLEYERFADLGSLQSVKDDKEKTENDSNKNSNKQVGYNYCDSVINKNMNDVLNPKVSEFKLPDGLTKIPDHINLPNNNKTHRIIEKTASFIAEHGLQMEIYLKTKEASNSNFEFLSVESPLNSYYKFILSEIKSERYIVSKDKESESDSDNEFYLHPDLMFSKTKKESYNLGFNSLNNVSKDDSYSKLVKNFKDKFSSDINDNQGKFEFNEMEIEKKDFKKIENNPLSITNNDFCSLIPKPPPNVEIIINKLAQYVGEKGEKFEHEIKSLNDSKFEFLNNGHVYHAFYVQQKIRSIKENKFNLNNCSNVSRNFQKLPVIFSISKKEQSKFLSESSLSTSKNLMVSNFNLKKNSCDETGNEKTLSGLKALQEKRKKKALMFLKMLEKDDKLPKPVKTYGPNLPQQKKNLELSPTIKKVTSPVHFSTDQISYNFEEKNSKQIKAPHLLSSKNEETENDDENISFIKSRRLSLSPPKRYQDVSDLDLESKKKKSYTKSSRSSRKKSIRHHDSYHRHRHSSSDSSSQSSHSSIYSVEKSHKSKYHKSRHHKSNRY